MANFQDESTDCAICLGSLMILSEQEQQEHTKNNEKDDNENENENENEQEQKQKNITLKCGHKYHLDCIIEQIKVGSMIAKNDDQRLLFTGIQCAKCAKIFVGTGSGGSGSGSGSGSTDHPDLPKDLIRSTDKLRTKVDKLILEHNLILPLSQKEKEKEEEEEGSNNIVNDDEDNETLFREARRKYAFYLCSHCEEPYFGGTVSCADENPLPTPPTTSTTTTPDQYDVHAPVPVPAVEKRLCPGCTPETQLICQNPIEHGRYLIWKCRYCCKPSTHVCYGQVHFCNDCHDKNSQRVATEAAAASSSAKRQGGRGQEQRRPILEAIPCPGGESCKYPKPPPISSTPSTSNNCKFHLNGSTKDCEQVYSCAICDSVPNNDSSNILNNSIEPGSHNFIFNPNGEFGLNGWRRTNQYSGWQVEERHDEEPILLLLISNDGNTNSNNNNNSNSDINPITTNFVSSFQQCVMMQSIDLSRVLRLGERRRLREGERDNNTNNDNDNNQAGSIINDDTIIPIEVSARYTGRNDCPSVFMLSAILSDYADGGGGGGGGGGGIRRQDQILTTEVLEAPPGNYWERTSLVFHLSIKELETSFLSGRPVITIIVKGKDTRFWQGNFGSKVANISLRIIGNSDFINELVIVPPSAEDENENEEIRNNTTTNHIVVGPGGDRGDRGDRSTSTPNSAMTHRMILWDIVIPVACFLILAWLAASKPELQ